MNRIFSRIFIIAILLLSLPLQAQKRTAVKRVSDKTCDCIEKSNPDTVKTEAQFTSLLQRCMGVSMLEDLDKLMKEQNIKKFDAEAGRQIGMEIGKELVSTCPSFLSATARVKKNEIAHEIDSVVLTVRGTSTGTLLRTETQDFVVFIVKDGNGREQKLYWIDYFAGSDACKSNPDLYKNENVEMSWVEKEVYSPVLKDYVKIKVVTSLKKTN